MSLRNHNWRDVLKVLTKFGYVLDRQRGSHMILKKDSRLKPVPTGADLMDPDTILGLDYWHDMMI